MFATLCLLLLFFFFLYCASSVLSSFDHIIRTMIDALCTWHTLNWLIIKAWSHHTWDFHLTMIVNLTFAHLCVFASHFGYWFIVLSIHTGNNPQVGKGTMVYLPITNNKDFTKDPAKWDARIRNIDSSRLTLQVRIPAGAAVGVWRLRISTKPQGSRDIKTFEVNNKIYVLFNAWNKGICFTIIILYYN